MYDGLSESMVTDSGGASAGRERAGLGAATGTFAAIVPPSITATRAEAAEPVPTTIARAATRIASAAPRAGENDGGRATP
jgi:hypothetical protein